LIASKVSKFFAARNINQLSLLSNPAGNFQPIPGIGWVGPFQADGQHLTSFLFRWSEYAWPCNPERNGQIQYSTDGWLPPLPGATTMVSLNQRFHNITSQVDN
jgi:hypothetical protein